MTPIQWYYARGTEQSGPVTSAELKQLADAGKLQPDDLVWREGMADWAVARNVRGLFDGAAAPPKAGQPAAAPGHSGEAAAAAAPIAAPPPAAPMPHLFDVAIERVRWASSAVQIEAIGELFGLLGHHVLYAAIVLVVGMGILQAVKGAGSYVAVVAGAVAAVALAVLQYTARRSCGALHRTSGTAGAAIASRTVPDCFALLAALGGLLVLAGAVVGAVEAAQYTPVLYGLAGLAVCAYAALVALNPEALGVAIAPEAGAAEEAVGVMALMLKIAARVVPVAYGAGVVCATLILIYAYFQVFSAAGAAAGAITAGTATVQFFVFAGLPLAGYLAFLLGCLLIELARAVLRVPGKLDALGRPTEAPPAAGPEAPPAAQRPAEKPQPPQ